MSDTPATQVAPKLNAIQIIEQEVAGFIKQREQAIANVHAVEGAIQAAQHLLGRLKAEAAKAEAAVATEVQEVVTEVGTAVEKAGAKVIEFAKKEL